MGVLADKDIDQTMAADWNEILERHTVEEEVEETPAAAGAQPDESAHAPADGQQADTAGERQRDESGRFKPAPKASKGTKTEGAAAKDSQPAAGKKGAQSAGAEGDQTQQPDPAAANSQQLPADGQQRDITRPPSSWKPTARAEWAKLPESVRAEIHRRETDFMAGQSQLLPDAKFGKDMREVVEPFRMLIESEGGNPAAAVQDLLRTAAILRTGTPQQKYQTIANVANRFGLDLRVFAPRPQQGAQLGQQQPGSVPAQQQFRDPRVDQLLANMQTAEQQRVTRETTETEGLVSHWMNETDAQGQPKRPYVGDVINEMSALIPQIKQANPTLTHAQALEQAYERAIWGNPEIRMLLQQQQQTAADAQRRAENQQRTQGARRAASVNVPRRASTPAAAKPGTLEETLSATARELGLIS